MSDDPKYGPEAIEILRGLKPAPQRSSVLIGGDEIGWSRCPDVESVPGRCSGAWVLKNSRVMVHGILINAASGCSAAEIADMFEVPSDAVRCILAFAEAREPTAEQELYDIILDLLRQDCAASEDDEAFDSRAISAYERAIIALEQAGYVEIDNGPGRIFGRLTEQGRMLEAWMALHDRCRRIADARRHLATVPGASERRDAVAGLYGITLAELDDEQTSR